MATRGYIDLLLHLSLSSKNQRQIRGRPLSFGATLNAKDTENWIQSYIPCHFTPCLYVQNFFLASIYNSKFDSHHIVQFS